MKSYLDDAKIFESINALKAYCKALESEENEKINKNKRSLINEISDYDTIFLQIDLKKVPTNSVAFTQVFHSLPHPWQIESENDICLIVRDLNTKKSLSDRELDLRLTREHYEKKLLDAGLDYEFLKQRITILPMRQFITEHMTQEAKSKLCSAYEIFLAEHTLMNNRFKHLNLTLGSKFWVTKKKAPVPVQVSKLSGEQLKDEILNAIKSTKLTINGRGSTVTLRIGVYTQTEQQLSDNLSYLLKEVYKLIGDNVSMLKLKRSSTLALPIYADLGWKNDVELNNPSKKRESQPIIDEFPLFNNSNIAVYPTGEIKLMKRKAIDEETGKKVKKSIEDQSIDKMEDKWIRLTNLKRKKRQPIVRALAKRKSRVHQVPKVD